MLFETWGFVNVGSGKKQFTVIDRNCAATPFGTTLKLGRVERLLSNASVGALLTCTGNYNLKSGQVRVENFRTANLKGIFMATQYFVSIVSVASQVPQNLRQLTVYFNNAALVKTAWLCVAETGKPYTIPVPFADVDAATTCVKDIMQFSNCKAVVVGLEGAVVGSLPQKSSGVVIETNGAGKVNKASDETVAPKKAAPVEKPKVKAAPYFYFEEAPNMVLSVVAQKYRGGFDGHTNILVTGESGTGKTTIARKFAEAMGWSCHRLNCALITEPSDIAGQRAIKNGETTWEWSAVAKAMMEGGCVVILDELNRAYPNSLNSLFGLLDDERKTWFNDLELKVGPNVVFIATINQGSSYTGTFQADAALLNRFEYVLEMGDVPQKEQVKILEFNCEVTKEMAQSIVKVSTLINTRLSDVPVSIRTLKAVASAIHAGFPHREAWQFVLVNRVSDTNRRDLVDLLNNNLSTMGSSGSIKLIF